MPRHIGQERIAGYGVVHIGLNIRHKAHGTLPSFLSARIVEQDEATKGVALCIGGHDVWGVFVSHFEADCVAKRRKALRWANGA